MKRLVCLALLLLTSLPAFAQDGPPVLGQALPNDPALLMRMRDQLTQELQRITHELQRTQQMLSVVNPNDTQTIGALTAQQAELARQMGDVMRQLHAPNVPNMGAGVPGASVPGAGVPGPDVRPGLTPAPAFPPGLGGLERQIPDWRQTEPVMPPGIPMLPPESMVPGMPGGMPMSSGGMMSGNMMGGMPPGMPSGFYNPTPPNIPFNPADIMPNNVPHWGNPPPDLEAAYWGPRLPRELTDMRQSVESLQREIASLRDTVRQLETQIQLLSRNILLNDRANERMNEWMIERMRENGE